MKEVSRQVTERYVAQGSNHTVSDAHALLGRLPNGWLLQSLAFEPTYGWVATVVGPTEVVT